jgi:hypothetical protein
MCGNLDSFAMVGLEILSNRIWGCYPLQGSRD